MNRSSEFHAPTKTTPLLDRHHSVEMSESGSRHGASHGGTAVPRRGDVTYGPGDGSGGSYGSISDRVGGGGGEGGAVGGSDASTTLTAAPESAHTSWIKLAGKYILAYPFLVGFALPAGPYAFNVTAFPDWARWVASIGPIVMYGSLNLNGFDGTLRVPKEILSLPKKKQIVIWSTLALFLATTGMMSGIVPPEQFWEHALNPKVPATVRSVFLWFAQTRFVGNLAGLNAAIVVNTFNTYEVSKVIYYRFFNSGTRRIIQEAENFLNKLDGLGDNNLLRLAFQVKAGWETSRETGLSQMLSVIDTNLTTRQETSCFSKYSWNNILSALAVALAVGSQVTGAMVIAGGKVSGHFDELSKYSPFHFYAETLPQDLLQLNTNQTQSFRADLALGGNLGVATASAFYFASLIGLGGLWKMLKNVKQGNKMHWILAALIPFGIIVAAIGIVDGDATSTEQAVYIPLTIAATILLASFTYLSRFFGDADDKTIKNFLNSQNERISPAEAKEFLKSVVRELSFYVQHHGTKDLDIPEELESQSVGWGEWASAGVKHAWGRLWGCCHRRPHSTPLLADARGDE